VVFIALDKLFHSIEISIFPLWIITGIAGRIRAKKFAAFSVIHILSKTLRTHHGVEETMALEVRFVQHPEAQLVAKVKKRRV
jgi:hypothetical protein